MNLHKQGRYWWVDITIDGTRHRFSTKMDDKAKAGMFAAREIQRLKDVELLGQRESITLGAAAERWLQSSAALLADMRNNQSRVEKLLGRGNYEGRWHFDPTMPLERLTSAKVSQLKDARRAEGNAPGTINKEVAILQRLYNLASKEWGYAVAPGVSFKKIPTTSKTRWLREDEEAGLLGELSPDRVIRGFPPPDARPPMQRRILEDQQDLVVFLLDTGCRYSEATHVTWDAVDTRDWVSVNIYRTKVGNEGVLHMTDRLRDVMQRRHERRGNAPYLFPSRVDPSRPRGHATRGIMLAADRAGINTPHKVERWGKFTVHSLRDTFASKLVQRGVSLYTVQKLLGHASPVMTQKYANLAPDRAAAEAAAVLNNGGSG